jgi:hypothetical protein
MINKIRDEFDSAFIANNNENGSKASPQIKDTSKDKLVNKT